MASLAVKYRPKEFSDCVGQSSIIKIFQNQIQTRKFKHVYLLVGPSGTGKTTLGRILASKINGSLDGVEELDAASNNGVDNIRNITRAAKERSLSAEYKIYILDEVHALTTQSWQALLKCLEEPPEHTIFMLCTTDPQKIPATILNRCQRYNLSKVDTDSIRNRLTYICEQEGYTDYFECVDYISKTCGGGVRDAICDLEKVASLSTSLTIQNTLYALGMYSYDTLFDVYENIMRGNSENTLKIVSDTYNSGNDLKRFVDQFFTFMLDIMKYNLFHNTNSINIPESYRDRLDRCVSFENSSTYIMKIVDKVLELKQSLKGETAQKSVIETFFVHLSRWDY